MLSSAALLTAIALLYTVQAYVCARLMARHAAKLGLVRMNYRNEPIVASLGLSLAAPAVFCYFLAAIADSDHAGLWSAFAAVAFAAGLLGLMDDRLGSRDVGGFRGHFGELRRGRLTTGAAKALFLPCGVFLTAILLLRQGVIPAVFTTLLVALSANAVNLLDVRPARAVTAWLAAVVGLGALAIAVGGSLWPVGILCGGVLLYWPEDAGRRGMLGDVGSNFLGAVMGLQVAVATPAWAQCILGGLLLSLNVYCERHSLSAAIDRSSWLRWMDAPGRWALRCQEGNRNHAVS